VLNVRPQNRPRPAAYDRAKGLFHGINGLASSYICADDESMSSSLFGLRAAFSYVQKRIWRNARRSRTTEPLVCEPASRKTARRRGLAQSGRARRSARKCQGTERGVHEIGMRVALTTSNQDATAARLALSAAWTELNRSKESSPTLHPSLGDLRQCRPPEEPNLK
jgi:hypothetical protein